MSFTIRPLLITLLVLNAAPVYAEWVSISISKGGAGGYTVYFDPDTIRRNGDLVKMWTLHDYKTTQTHEGKSFLSAKTQIQFDCAEERMRILAYWVISGSMGRGEVVTHYSDEGEWEPIPPRSRGQSLWEVACGKK